MNFGNIAISTLTSNLPLFGGACLLLGLLIGYLWGGGRNFFRRQQQPASSARSGLRKFYDLSTTLIHTVNYQRVLDIALNMSLAAFSDSARPLVSAVLLFDDDRLIIQSARRFTNADMRGTFEGKKGALGSAIRTGESILTMNPRGDHELKRVVALCSCGAVYIIPLRSGLDIYGVFVFGNADRNFFNADNREILDIIAAQAISAMQNAQLYNALEAEKERIIDAQEEARKKLARDLHDGPTQSVSAIAMRVNFARRLMEKKPDDAQEELFKIEELARNTTKEIRHMLFTLRPLVLESQGLKAALEAMAAKVNDTYQQNVIIDVDENTVEVLDMTKLGVMFFIVEEAITNARKHARADHIWVRLRSMSPDVGVLEIEDDGIGFDVMGVAAQYDARSSLGLFTLRERTELINGIFQIDSKHGRGTKIQVLIPFSEAGIDRLRKASH